MQINMQTQGDVDAANEKKRKTERTAQIQAELDDIEYRQGRPIRAISLGTATDEDRAKLAELEARAVELRKELKSL